MQRIDFVRDIITIIPPHTHNASQYCPKMAEVFVANAEERGKHSLITKPRGDILLKCFVVVGSTVSRDTCVYPLKGWGMFALKMVALLCDDTLV